MITTVREIREASDPPPSRWTASRQGIVFGVVLLALLFAHREALSAMVFLWNVSPMYSYGFAVPFVSAFLLWARRDAMARLTPRPSLIGGGLALAAWFGMTLAARASGIQVLEQAAFLIGLIAVVLILLGQAYVRTAWAALAYLLLMIPVWDGLTERLHVPFQLRSAEIGASLLQAAGIPAYREGTFITLPAITLEVARACSGVNYLVAVLALGLPLSYVYLQGMWRRVLLLGSAILVAALSNGLRVALIGILAHFEIGSPLHGPFHVLHGLFVSAIGYVVLFVGLRLLSTDRRAARQRPAVGSSMTPARVSVAPAVVLLMIFIGLGSNLLALTPKMTALRDSLDTIPVRFGEWSVEAGSEAPSESSRWPGADAELRRRYRRSDGAVVDVYVGYFTVQQQRKEIVNDRATDLHDRARRVRVGGTQQGAFDANVVEVDGGAETLFWYDVNARPETSRYVVKLRTLWNAVSGRGTSGAAIVLTARAPHANLDEILQDIAWHLQQALSARLPGYTGAGIE